MRFHHYAIRTEATYWFWIRRFIFFHNKRHPKEMGPAEVHSFLTHLAARENVAASTQNQALNALVFLYGHVLLKPLGLLDEIPRPQRPVKLPVVLTAEEVKRVLAVVTEKLALPLRLLYGTGMRVMEGVRLRVKDVDFGAGQIVVRDGKGFRRQHPFLETFGLQRGPERALGGGRPRGNPAPHPVFLALSLFAGAHD